MFVLSTYDLNHEDLETSHKEFCQLANAVNEYQRLLNLGGDVPMLYLSADEHEMLISGICSTCWDIVFGKEEE